VKPVRPIGAGVPDDAAGAGRGIDGQLRARAEDVADVRITADSFALRARFERDAALIKARSLTSRFVGDSLLEQRGFEPLVPPRGQRF
jgi:hypothetical protein